MGYRQAPSEHFHMQWHAAQTPAGVAVRVARNKVSDTHTWRSARTRSHLSERRLSPTYLHHQGARLLVEIQTDLGPLCYIGPHCPPHLLVEYTRWVWDDCSVMVGIGRAALVGVS